MITDVANGRNGFDDGPAGGRALRERLPLFVGLGLAAVVVVALILFWPRQSDLDKLNGDVKDLNQAITTAQTELAAYDAAATEAASWRSTYAEESDEDPTVLGIVDGHVAAAQQYVATARDELGRAGAARTEYTAYAKAEHDAVKAAKTEALAAARDARFAVEELRAVPALADDVLNEYVRTFIWFETDYWWSSEAAEYPSGQACYYGEVVSTVAPDGTIQETIVDDGQATAFKTFTVEDYEQFVAAGIVPAMEKKNPDREDVGRYLCGGAPQAEMYGALGEPEVTLVKERGQLALSQEDENAMVGNYEYGSWCRPGADGAPQAVPEEEAEALLAAAATPQAAVAPQASPAAGQNAAGLEWCWHMPEGGDPRYYYYGHYANGAWLYSRGPRRCYDCNVGSWTGRTLVPSGQMAQATGMDSPDVRGAASDGGPGTGK